MAKSSDEIYVSGEGTKEITVVYPVSYEIMDNARSVSRQVRMIPPLVGTFNWASTDRCCDIGNVSGTWIPLCSSGCSCEGCTSGGFTFNYEGYSLSFDGMECGCEPYSGPTEDDGPYDASASVVFSKKAIIFEDAYENKPGESVPKQSTRTVLSCVAHGGPNGGRARFTISNAEKLVRLSGIDLPMEVDVPAGHKVEFYIVYEGGEASGSENDIVATAQFIDNEEGDLGREEDELTVVEVELSPVNSIDKCYNRHQWGICEKVLLEWSPVLEGLSFTIAGDGIVNPGEKGETFAFFDCPTIQMSDILSIVYKDSSYVVASQVFAPSMIIARNPLLGSKKSI